jgi:hypothetical protein
VLDAAFPNRNPERAMDTASEHVRELLKQLAEMEAELATLSQRVKRSQELLHHGVLKNWSVPPEKLEERASLTTRSGAGR